MRGFANRRFNGVARRILFLVLAAAVIPACGGSGGSSGGGGGGISWTQIYTDAGANGAGGGTVEVNNLGTVRRIQGSFFNDLNLGVTLPAPFTGQYLLNAPTYMGKEASGSTAKKNEPQLGGPTLTIPAGTTILGKGGTPPAMLVIRRGAKIMAIGTPGAPIVFTSSQPAGSRAPSDWGGVVINGNAHVNDVNQVAATPLPLGEGASGMYGSIGDGGDGGTVGPVENDNSGTLQYVRIEFAGHIFTSDDELNGLALQGVGSGTTIDHIQIHRSSDDGIEFFGGTVNVHHIVLTGNLDDCFDWTGGWTGSAQFIIAQQYADFADNGFECDSNAANNGFLPRAHPTIANFTLIGNKTDVTGGDQGMLLRQGTAANLFHGVVMNFRVNGADVDHLPTYDSAYAVGGPYTSAQISGALTIERCIFFDNGTNAVPATTHFPTVIEGTEPVTVDAFIADLATAGKAANILAVVTPLAANATSQATPDFKAAAAGQAVTGVTWAGPLVAVNGYLFTQTTFIGALDDVGGNDWTQGWTSYPQN